MWLVVIKLIYKIQGSQLKAEVLTGQLEFVSYW